MQSRSKGFSLVEIVIALGIVSFALVAILGMFPVAMNAARDSRNETRAAAIAQTILSQLKTQPADRASLPLGPDPTSSSSSIGNLPMKLNQNWPSICVVYDESGQPLRRVNDSQYASGTMPAAVTNAAFQTRIMVTANQPITGLSRVTLEVSYPATVPLANRSFATFVTYLNNVVL